jgi:hypothetical protein
MIKPLSGVPFGLINIAMVNILIFTMFIVILILLDTYFFANYRRQLLDISIKTLLNNNVQISTDTYKKVIDKIRKNRYKYSSTTYLYRIMNIKLLIDLWLLKNTNSTENNISKKYLVLKNVLIILVLLITTILWFAHYLIPDNIQVLDLGLLVIDSNGFDNVRTYIWFLLRKIIVIIPMLVWYFSCANWWRFAILSPITMYSYQLWEATQDIQHLDAAGNIKAFPIVVIVVILLIMVSKIIRYRVDLLTLYDAVVKEIDSIIQNGELRANKSFHQNILRIKQLRQEIAGESNQNRRLDRLIALREELISETKIRP